MALRIYNTLSKKVEEFKTIKPREVKMYTCGPTVYNHAHIGNLRAYIVSDLLRRFLKYEGFKVTHVMNLTDVDDKTIKGAKNAEIPLREFTEQYAKLFFEDLQALNIELVEKYPRATDHVAEMAQIIDALSEKGFAYEGKDGSVYFAISKFKNYGQLAGLDKQSLQAGASGRVAKDEYGRENISDFALWKKWDEDDGEVFWETSSGKGRPGWHIECSAMSTKYLGASFDVHLGGVDLIFPHHTNEIAQSEAAFGKKFVNYWVHNEHLLVDGRKMSKSLGNFYTLRDLVAKDVDPIAFRYLMLASHYRKQTNFTWSAMHSAQNTVEKLRQFVEFLEGVKTKGKTNKDVARACADFLKAFEKALENDLDTSSALAALHELVHAVNKHADDLGESDARDVLTVLRRADSVLGVLSKREKKSSLSKSRIEELLAQREKLKMEKRFVEADAIRSELRAKGIVVEDTRSGPRWHVS
ncbi:MAG TPA: cysteine--tRNA ligase [Candidatus Norongarragalinales archaeon]|jgi:cysteinyl-tRNA synthetase|nr:cysteine--tRNA ligase [Candidatus Norongarragalinales archaeon]